MVRLIIAMVGTVALVTFAMMNTQDVQLSLLFGEPVQIRLISLLSVTFLAGLASSAFYQMLGRANRRARRRRRQLVTTRKRRAIG